MESIAFVVILNLEYNHDEDFYTGGDLNVVVKNVRAYVIDCYGSVYTKPIWHI